MTRPRLVLLMRCLVLAVCLCAIGVPWWVVLGLMMPVFATSTCSQCDGGTAPASFQADFSGMAAGVCNSGACTTYTSFVYAFQTVSTSPYCLAQSCTWLYSTSFTICGSCGSISSLSVWVFLDCDNIHGGGSTHYWIYVVGPGASWKKDYGTTKPSCSTLSSESIPWNANQACGFGPPFYTCDGSGSTCLLTAL